MNRLATAAFLVLSILPGRPAHGQPAAPLHRLSPASSAMRAEWRSSAPRSPQGRLCAERQTATDIAVLSITPPAAGEVTVIVRAAGFADWRQAVASPASPSVIEIVLQPAAIRDEVTVTPTRSEEQLGTIPASVSVIGQLDIQRRPAVVPDDLLRQLPEFSLFRRSSSLRRTRPARASRFAASARAASAAASCSSMACRSTTRSAVGCWTALPMESAQRIEVVNGASSSLRLLRDGRRAQCDDAIARASDLRRQDGTAAGTARRSTFARPMSGAKSASRSTAARLTPMAI